MRVNETSNEWLSRPIIGQASTQYNKTGVHLERNKLTTKYFNANLPTLLKMKLNEVKN